MEKHFLLLLLGFSLLVGFLQALTCVHCPLFVTEGICLKKQEICEARDGQSCVLRVISSGGKVVYGFQGCSNLCFNGSITKQNVTMKLRCCRNKELCNRP